MSSGPSKPNWVSPSEMNEIRAFNASLTSSGQRSRPGRPQGPSVGNNRRGSSGFAPGRPISNARPVTHGGPNVARPGNGASHGLMTNWTVGATTAQPAFKPASGGRSRSRSPTRSTFTPTKIRPYTVGRAPAPAPPSPPKIRESVLVADGTIPFNAPAISEPLRNREPIVTNMTSEDPSKPWIPGHFQQASAFEKIRHLADITGLSLEELTSDGITIPALSKTPSVSMNTASQAPAAAPASTFTSASIGSIPVTSQAQVDPTDWMLAYNNRGSINGGHAIQAPAESGAEPSRIASYSDMDIDMDDGHDDPSSSAQPKTLKVGTLADSQWATAPSQPSFSSKVPSTYSFQIKHAFGAQATTSATSRATTFVHGQTWDSTRSGTENVKPTPSQIPSQQNSTAAHPVNELTRALAESKPEKKLGTLKDSRWA